ncbi:MAG: HAD domain-containing protein [Candidatus Thorarchaeota archaeon]|nr:hypothetical protein [Thermoplasmatales archaeon]
MKIIFLDIDGVLVTPGSLRASGGKVFSDFHPPCVACLNEIIKKSNAKIVISSTWRHGHPKYFDIRSFLEEQGVKGEIIGMTRTGDSAHRGIKIMAWLADHSNGFQVKNAVGQIIGSDRIDSYVILDDTLVRPYDNLVQTDMNDGLNPNHIKKALEILNG